MHKETGVVAGMVKLPETLKLQKLNNLVELA